MIPIGIARLITGHRYIAHALAIVPSIRRGTYSIHLRNFGNIAKTLRTLDRAGLEQLEQILMENRIIGFSPSPLDRVLRLFARRLGEVHQCAPDWERIGDEKLLRIGKLRLRIRPGKPSWLVRAYYLLCVVVYRYPKPEQWMQYELTIADADYPAERGHLRLTAILRNLLHAGAAVWVGVLASLQTTFLDWILLLSFGLFGLALVLQACDKAAIRQFDSCEKS